MSTRFGALVTALAFTWCCAPAAQAAVRHAVPSGGAAAGACDVAAPCTLAAAFAAAVDTDEIRLASGTYDAPATLTLTANQSLVAPEPGAASRPVILDSSATSAKVLNIDADDVTLRGLRVEGTSTAATDDLVAFAGTRSGGQVEAMEVIQSGTAPALTGIGLTVRDSLVVNRTTTGVAGLMTGYVIGSTFIADLSSGIALEVSTARFPVYGQLIIRNAILRGGAGTGGRDLRVTDDDGFGPKSAAADLDFSNFRSGRTQGPFGGGLVLGTNNVTAAAPLLVNLSGGLDIHQQDGSPTIGVGSLADASTSTTDWEGDPRVLGDLPDMGADEAALAPLLSGSSVGTITATGATVSGDVTPNGLATTYRVEYGATTSYGSATAWTAAGSGGLAVAVAVPLTGLASSTPYHARLVVQNAKGTVQGPDLAFATAAPTTQPTISGSVAGSVTATGATISGSVGPGGAATEYRVEYGATAGYGSATAWTSAGSGVTGVPVGVALAGLTSSTGYHARLVARNAGGTTNGPDLTFTTSDLAPTVLGSGASTVTAGGATISATVNPNRVATTYVVQWGTTIAYGSSTAATSAGSGALDVVASVPLTGLQSTTLYHARVVATSAGGTTNGADVTFTTSDLPPSVTGTSAGSVTTSGATISGSVNPNRVATSYRVEYGLTTAYGSQTTLTSAGAGSSAVAVSVPLSGLTSSTTYHARLVADSAAGTTAGPDLTFTTGDVPPSVSGTSAGSVTTSGATISGSVNPNRAATSYRVEYGLTTAYGSQTTLTSAGSGTSAVAVSVPLSGLTSSTTYHARLVAVSAGGTTNGPDLTFTTGDLPPSVANTATGSVTTSGATVSGDVTPNRVATSYRVEYGLTTAYGSQTTLTAAGSGSSAVAVSVPLSALTSSTTYHARLVAVSAGGTTNGPDLAFTTGDLPPSVSGTGAGSITASGATISGTVNPNRVATSYRVEYGLTTLYGSQTAITSAGSGSTGVAVGVPLAGLTSSTVYHARLVAVSAGGTTNGPDLTFTTSDLPPSVANTASGSVTTSGATVSGDVNPNGLATSYRVEYGLTTAYGSQTTLVSAGLGSTAVAASVPLTGLTSSTTYHARLVAVSAGGTTNGPDLTFTTGDLPPSVANSAAGSVTTSAATVSGDVTPNRLATSYRVEYGLTTAYGSQTTLTSAGSGSSAVAASVPLTGLTSSTTYHARLVAVSAGGTTNGPDLTFTTGDLPPSVSGTSAGSVTTSGATISGDVNPNRVATSYRVEYGLTTAYGSQTTLTSAGSGTSAVAVSVPLSGLTSSTTYHARLVAVSAGGTTNGPDLTFTTGDLPPSVANTAFGSVTSSGATISGDVNPNRAATSYRVEYGLTTAYGSQTTPASAGSGSAAVAVSVPITGLASSTTYHARLVAVSAGGTTNGPDLTFTTSGGPPPPAPSIANSATGSVGVTGATITGGVNPNGSATDYRVEYGTSTAYGSQTPLTSAGSGSSSVAVSVPLTGLTSSTTYHARLAAVSAGGTTNGPDLTFTTGDLPPSASGTSAGSVTTSGATISGSVNPNRVATSYRVEYGLTTAYGSQTTLVSAGSGSSAVAVGVPLSGLTSSTTYHARLVAVSAGGTTNGPDLTFTTGDLPPSVANTAFGSVTTSGATISGDVNPNRAATSYRVEYGLTTAYGSQTTLTAAGSGSSAVAASVPLASLTASTTYHARLVAVSAGGTTNGPDLTFTTAEPPAVTPPSVSASAAVQPTTTGATVKGDVAPNGDATTYRVELGTTTAYDTATAWTAAGAGAGAVAVTVPLTGLTPATTYHARLVAKNAGGTTNGPDLTFTTLAGAQPTGGGTPPLTGGGLPSPPAPEGGSTSAPGVISTAAAGDRSAPGLAAAFTRKAIRRGGRARLRVLVSENATVGVRMLDRRSRTVLRLTDMRVTAGRRTVLKVTTRTRGRALRRGTYRVFVTARDASGNTTTRAIRLRLR